MGTGKVRGDQDELTPKQRMFVAEYLKDHNGTRAAKAAGYAAPSVAATKLLSSKKVEAVIVRHEQRVIRKKMKPGEIDAGKVLQRLADIVNRDVTEFIDEDGRIRRDLKSLPRRLRSLIDSIETDEVYDQQGNLHVKTKLKLPPLLPALDLAMKHKGLFAAEKHEHAHRVTLDLEPYYAQHDAADPIQARLDAAARGIEFKPEDTPLEAEYSVKSLIDGEE